MKKVLAIIGIVLAVLVAGVFIIMAPSLKAMSKVEQVDIDANLKVFTGGGGNSAVYVYPDKSAIIIIDTKMGKAAGMLRKYADLINPNAKITIINTHEHADHVGGNKLYPSAEVITGDNEGGKPNDLKGTLIKTTSPMTIKLPDDIIEIRNTGAGHSFADTIVYFKKRKLIMTGDLVFNGWAPVLVRKGGADIDKWVKSLEFILKNYDIKTAVPGHGSIGDGEILKAQITYFEEIKAAINDKSKLKELEEKYKGQYHIPGFSGFDKTVGFVMDGRR